MLSFDYALRCIIYPIFGKLMNMERIPNIFKFNCLLLLTSGFFSLCYSYWGKPNILYFQLIIIVLRILIIIIMDNINYNLFKYKGLSPPLLMFYRGIINIFLFLIFSVIFIFVSENGKELVFSYLSNINLVIILKIVYTLIFSIQKYVFLMILFEEDAILASFSRLVYFLEPYISMTINIVFYDEIFKRPLFEMILEIISALFIVFALITSVELIIMPCNCLSKDLKIIISQRSGQDKIDASRMSELDELEEEEEEEE